MVMRINFYRVRMYVYEEHDKNASFSGVLLTESP